MQFENRPPDADDLKRALVLTPRYDRAGPRYTSYPPAPHFSEAVGPAEAAAVYASRTPESEPLSVYIHLPFCEAMCTFCGCNVIVSRNKSITERYLETLEPELDLAARALEGGNRRVLQFHLGGGTPTYFPPEALERIHAMVAARFDLDAGAELAIEVDPCVTTREHVETLAKLGWRRVSMGLQDFDFHVQQAVNRIQTEEETKALVEHCREVGFESVNVDLMYGLPYQTVPAFEDTLETVIRELSPDRVSLFGYAHVPWLKPHQRKIDTDTLPKPADRLALFHAGLKAFVGAGYEFIGMDHFAKPGDELSLARQDGTLHRNFMGFHTHAGTDMVAFGITGIGDVQGVYLQNQHKLTAWEREVAEGRLPVHKGYRRTAEDEHRSRIIQELMCNGRVDGEVLAPGAADWRAALAVETADLEPMRVDGLVVTSPEGLALTPLGRLFVRNVCMVFDTHLRARQPGKDDKPRYSRTV